MKFKSTFNSSFVKARAIVSKKPGTLPGVSGCVVSPRKESLVRLPLCPAQRVRDLDQGIDHVIPLVLTAELFNIHDLQELLATVGIRHPLLSLAKYFRSSEGVPVKFFKSMGPRDRGFVFVVANQSLAVVM